MADWQFSVCAYYLPSADPAQLGALAKAAGFNGIEANPATVRGLADPEIADLGRELAAAGVPVETFHLPFSWRDDLSDFSETQRRVATAGIVKWLGVAALLGAKAAIQHPTTRQYEVDAEGTEIYLRQLGRSLETLLPTAQRVGVRVTIENMLPGNGHRFGSRPEHFRMLAERFADPALGFCLDTGHALISLGEAAGEIPDAMGDRLQAYHLADNPGDRDLHLAPGKGNVDWGPVFARMSASPPPVMPCIETPPFAPANGGYATQAWCDLVDAVQRLAKAEQNS